MPRFLTRFLLEGLDENKSTTEDVLLLNSDTPYVIANSIINATLGKSIELICTVYNVRNYKVSSLTYNL